MVTHRARITEPKQINHQVLARLKSAYDAASHPARGIQQSKPPLGLAQPARRALEAARIQTLERLGRFSEDGIGQLHGIGRNALTHLRRVMTADGLSFAGGKW